MPSRYSDRGRMLAKAMREDPELEQAKMLAEFSEPYGTISAVNRIRQGEADPFDYLAAVPLLGIPARLAKKSKKVADKVFDTGKTYYHGTDKPFDELEGMTFLTESPSEASSYAQSKAFRENVKNDRWLRKNKKASLPKDQFGEVPYTGIVGDIDADGVWMTDNGAVLKKGKEVTYLDNVVETPNTFRTTDGEYKVSIEEGQSGSYEDAREFVGADKPAQDISSRVIPAHIAEGKLKELSPLEANTLGARLQKNLSKNRQKDLDDLLKKIEKWKEEGYVGIKTTSDDPGFTIAGETPPNQVIMFDPENIQSAFDPKKQKAIAEAMRNR
jgi:hypothetical protein